MKAWRYDLSHIFEWHGSAVVFAETRSKARAVVVSNARDAGWELNYQDKFSVRRAPEYDRIADSHARRCLGEHYAHIYLKECAELGAAWAGVAEENSTVDSSDLMPEGYLDRLAQFIGSCPMLPDDGPDETEPIL